MEKHVFVAREREIGELDGFLHRALAGQGQVCFVTGEAGSGKTALVTEFARRAEDQYEELIVAVGQADAQTGVGDPYLPFREVLGLLTGDVEAKLSQGAITQENAGRLQRVLALSGEALVECGADLIGVFVPGAALAMRAGVFVAGKVGWLAKLERLAGSPVGSTVSDSGGVEQSHIFEQYTNVMRALAEKQPLLLVLDDLQWADSASLSLLFHLGRRIGDSRILIVGTYRPEEIALGRAGERHPLEKVLAELKRYCGHICVDLDLAQEAEGRRFVDVLLDTEPNRLGQEFRAAMYRHTEGHPLFTIELLRDMQERGDLIQDEQGRWVEAASLNWGVLPTRVEGVIEERIGRLEKELREMLTVASVEGEDFTAQVVAHVQAMSERNLVHRLTRELDRQHRLVQEQGIARLREQRLSLYRFRHNLFQSYLYGDLGPTEREFLHEDVGNVLEALYGEQVDDIVVQLAWHFERARATEKARHYLHRAGEQARQRYAYDEAVAYFGRALDLTPESDYMARYWLVLARERVHDRRGARDAQHDDLTALEGLAEALDDNRLRAEVALRRANYAEATSDFPAAMTAAQRAIDLNQQEIGDSQVADRVEAKAHLIWGTALWRQGHYDEAQMHLERALPIFRRIGAVRQVAEVLRASGNVSLYQGQLATAQDYHQQALVTYQQVGDRRGVGVSLNNLAITFGSLGEYDQTEVYLRQALDIIREVGDRRAEGTMQGNLGVLSAILGRPGQAKTYTRQALQIIREADDRQGEALALRNLGYYSQALGEYAEARAHHEQALLISRAVGDRAGEGASLGYLGEVAQALGEYAQAETCCQQALMIRRELGLSHHVAEDLARLAQIALAQGDLDGAQARVAEILPCLDDDPLLQGAEDVFQVFVACYRVLHASGDPWAAHILDQAHSLLQEQASKIGDEKLRSSFLENVASHREIMAELANSD